MTAREALTVVTVTHTLRPQPLRQAVRWNSLHLALPAVPAIRATNYEAGRILLHRTFVDVNVT